MLSLSLEMFLKKIGRRRFMEMLYKITNFIIREVRDGDVRITSNALKLIFALSCTLTFFMLALLLSDFFLRGSLTNILYLLNWAAFFATLYLNSFMALCIKIKDNKWSLLFCSKFFFSFLMTLRF